MLRSQHAEATRRAVLDAARSAFGKKGYAQTSVEEIADAARVTKGAVYHHFASDSFRRRCRDSIARERLVLPSVRRP
jgi:AcrR family transcriptional regulator